MEEANEPSTSTVPHCWVCQRTEDQPSATLERDCACRGTLGYAHLSCLIDCARIQSGCDPPNNSVWTTCPVCHHAFNGGVQLGLARARLAAAESYLPTEDEEYLVAIQLYAVALVRCLNDFNSALPLLRKALKIRWRVHGSDHTVTLIATASLALLYHKQGHDDLALPLFEEALQGFRSKPDGRESWASLITIFNLARLYMRSGNFSDSLPLAEEAMVGFWWTLGKEHEDTLASIEALGELRFHMAHGEFVGRKKAQSHNGPYNVAELQHAKVHITEAFDGYRKTLGENHRKTISSEEFLRMITGKLESLLDKPLSDSIDSKELNPPKGAVYFWEEAEKDHSKKTILRGLKIANLGLDEFCRPERTDNASKAEIWKIELMNKVREHVTKALKRCLKLFSHPARPSKAKRIGRDRDSQNTGQNANDEDVVNNETDGDTEDTESKKPPAKRMKVMPTA